MAKYIIIGKNASIQRAGLTDGSHVYNVDLFDNYGDILARIGCVDYEAALQLQTLIESPLIAFVEEA